MKLNQATDYAFRAVLYLSRLSPGEVVETQVIADREHIPMRFLLKIFRMLTKAGIVQSYRGVNGGYALARSPVEITMKDVVEAVEGPVRINRCLVDPELCSKDGPPHCPLHQALGSIQKVLVEEFGRYNFQQLKEKAEGR